MANFLSLQPPDIDKFIRDLNKCRKELNTNVGTALEAGALDIEQEQKRIINSRSHRLSTYIHAEFQKTSKGKMYYRIGYTGKEPVEKWIHGVVLEFGRPGRRNKGYIYPERDTKEGRRKVKQRNGYIEEYSHIRRGFDNKVDEANKIVDEAFDKIVNELGDG